MLTRWLRSTPARRGACVRRRMRGGVGAGFARTRSRLALSDVQVMDRATGETLPMPWHLAAGAPLANPAAAMPSPSRSATAPVGGALAGGFRRRRQCRQRRHCRTRSGRLRSQARAVCADHRLAQGHGARGGVRVHGAQRNDAVLEQARRTTSASSAWLCSANARVPCLCSASLLLSKLESARDGAAPAAGASAANESDARQRADAAPARENGLGTGHGRNERSPTSYTDFERAQSTPNELIVIDYDSRDNLIANGVIPTPRAVPDQSLVTAGFVAGTDLGPALSPASAVQLPIAAIGRPPLRAQSPAPCAATPRQGARSSAAPTDEERLAADAAGDARAFR